MSVLTFEEVFGLYAAFDPLFLLNKKHPLFLQCCFAGSHKISNSMQLSIPSQTRFEQSNI